MSFSTTWARELKRPRRETRRANGANDLRKGLSGWSESKVPTKERTASSYCTFGFTQLLFCFASFMAFSI